MPVGTNRETLDLSLGVLLCGVQRVPMERQQGGGKDDGGTEPAPERTRKTTRKEFLRHHQWSFVRSYDYGEARLGTRLPKRENRLKSRCFRLLKKGSLRVILNPRCSSSLDERG
jgi:hypothetical protein